MPQPAGRGRESRCGGIVTPPMETAALRSTWPVMGRDEGENTEYPDLIIFAECVVSSLVSSSNKIEGQKKYNEV